MGARTVLTNLPVVFFDDTCLLCNHTVRVLLFIDRKEKLQFASLQSSFAADVLDTKTLALDAVVLWHQSNIYVKSSAFIKIAQILGFPYLLATILYVVPPVIRNFIYDFIARHRVQWFGRVNHCLLIKSKYKHRILG